MSYTDKKHYLRDVEGDAYYRVSVKDLYQLVYDTIEQSNWLSPLFKTITQPDGAEVLISDRVQSFIFRWFEAVNESKAEMTFANTSITLTPEFNEDMRKGMHDLYVTLAKQKSNISNTQLDVITHPEKEVDHQMYRQVKEWLGTLGDANQWDTFKHNTIIQKVCEVLFPDQVVAHFYEGDTQLYRNIIAVIKCIQENREPTFKNATGDMRGIIALVLDILRQLGLRYEHIEINDW